MSVRYDTAGPADEPVLWEMLTYAASMEGPRLDAIAGAQRDPGLSAYVRGFGRDGDLGRIARDGAEAVGAAWLRLWDGAPVAHKVATATEPELAIGIRPTHRGSGVGTALLGQLLAEADARYPAVVLSVREHNPSRRLYERMGFREVSRVVNRVGGASLVMRRAR